jgi:hypothetical protein
MKRKFFLTSWMLTISFIICTAALIEKQILPMNKIFKSIIKIKFKYLSKMRS